MALTTAAIAAGTALAGSGMSIAGGFAAKKAARKAARAAADSLEQAKRQIEIRRMEQLQVPLESYELEQQALVAGQQQAIEGLRESGQRAVQGGLPGLQAQVQAGAEGIRQDQAQAIYDRDKLIIDEQKTTDTQLANLDLSAAQGAQMAAAQADESAAQQFTAGAQGIAAAGMSLYKDSNLYKTVDQPTNDSGVLPFTPDSSYSSKVPQVSPFALNNGFGKTSSVFAPKPGMYPVGDFRNQTTFPGINDSFNGLGIEPLDFSSLIFSNKY